IVNPQRTIQLTAHVPCRPPYTYARAIWSAGACQIQTPSAAVTRPATSVAAHAVTRNPASSVSSTKSGTNATSTVNHKLPSGTSVWVNMRTGVYRYDGFLKVHSTYSRI